MDYICCNYALSTNVELLDLWVGLGGTGSSDSWKRKKLSHAVPFLEYIWNEILTAIRVLNLNNLGPSINCSESATGSNDPMRFDDMKQSDYFLDIPFPHIILPPTKTELMQPQPPFERSCSTMLCYYFSYF